MHGPTYHLILEICDITTPPGAIVCIGPEVRAGDFRLVNIGNVSGIQHCGIASRDQISIGDVYQLKYSLACRLQHLNNLFASVLHQVFLYSSEIFLSISFLICSLVNLEMLLRKRQI